MTTEPITPERLALDAMDRLYRQGFEEGQQASAAEVDRLRAALADRDAKIELVEAIARALGEESGS